MIQVFPSTLFRSSSDILKFVYLALFVSFSFDATHVFVRYFAVEYVYVFPFASFSAIPRAICWIVLLLDYFLHLCSGGASRKEQILFLIAFVFLGVNIFIQPSFEDKIEYLMFLVKFSISLLMYRVLIRVENLDRLIKLILLIFVIQASVVIVSALFEIKIFRAYGASRFGYSGLMVAVNQLSFVYITIITLLVLYRNQLRSAVFNTLLILFTISAAFLGTKALWAAMVLFYLVILNDKILNRKQLYYLSIAIVAVLSVLIYNYSSVFYYFAKLIENQGWIYAITSKRDVLVGEGLVPILQNFNVWNFLFGGINLKNGFFEMDFIDMFLFSGMIGILLFLFVSFKSVFSFPIKSNLAKCYIFLYFLIAFFAGHAFSSALNYIYMPVVCILFLRQTHNKSN